MKWNDIKFLRDFFKIKPMEFARFIGYDESTIRKNVQLNKDFKPTQEVLEKVLILFLAQDRSLSNLEELLQSLKKDNYYPKTSKNYVQSRIHINNKMNQIRDNELKKTELFLNGISLFDGKISEFEIKDDLIKILSDIVDNPKSINRVEKLNDSKHFNEFDISKSIILSFNIEYNAYDSKYPRPIIKDFHMKIPSIYQDSEYDLQTVSFNKEDKLEDHYHRFLNNIDEKINLNIKDENGFIGFKEFVLFLKKIYKNHLWLINGGFIMFTDGFDCELEFLKKHLDKYSKSVFNELPILKLNDYLLNSEIFHQKKQLNLYETATAFHLQCSLKETFQNCEYRNNIINELINTLYFKDADLSYRTDDINATFGSNKEYVKSYFHNYQETNEKLVEHRRKTYKS